MISYRLAVLYVLLLCCCLGVCRLTNNCTSVNQLKTCQCTEKKLGLDINCNNLTSQAVQKTLQHLRTLKHDISYLKLRHLDLAVIPEHFLKGIAVKHLTIVNSNISNIDPDAFDTERLAVRIESLDLSQNQLSQIPSSALKRLSELVYLNLNNNNISIIEANALEGLDNLIRISFYGNQIATVDDEAFDGASRTLARINLGKNRLEGFPVRAISGLSNLEHIELQENLVQKISEDDFEGLVRLDTLNLGSNQIKELNEKTFRHLDSLRSLELNNNRISHIHKDAFEGVEDTLEWLKLGDNRLNRYPSEALRNLTRLRQLDLYGNNISSIPDDAFDKFGSQLKLIDLHNNSISHIPTTTFESLHQLQWLHLQENKLNRLPHDTYDTVFDTLQALDVQNNLLDCDCHLIWFRDWSLNKGRKVIRAPEKVRCHRPKPFQGQAIENVPVEQMTCPMISSSPTSSARSTIDIFSLSTLLAIFWSLLAISDRLGFSSFSDVAQYDNIFFCR